MVVLAFAGAVVGALGYATPPVLIAMVVLTVVSVTGRALIGIGLGPVPGTYELIELGAAFAVFSFLPWCQLKRGHVTVDIFVRRFGMRADAVATLIGDALIFCAAAIVAWRLWLGLLDKLRFGETTYILGLPLWTGYAVAQFGALVFVAAAALTVFEGLAALRARGAGHR